MFVIIFVIGIVIGALGINQIRSGNKNLKPIGTVLDTSALLDGRLSSLLDAGLVQRPLLVPSRVMSELEEFVSNDANKYAMQAKAAARAIEWLEHASKIEYDDEYDKEDADQQVVLQALEHNYDVLSFDKAVIQNCEEKGINAPNVEILGLSLRPVYEVGDVLSIKLRYKGHKGSAIAVMPSGELVNVSDASSAIGTTKKIIITHIKYSSLNRLIEAKLYS